ncbi:MAG: hypothetical protein HC777_02280 [Hyphomonadaceae bacterium]|nr:hypothetical protein [Hyphomonadaceae bacterium]
MGPGGVFLGGSFRIERGGGDAILQFKNANIIENRASIQLSGSPARRASRAWIVHSSLLFQRRAVIRIASSFRRVGSVVSNLST